MKAENRDEYLAAMSSGFRPARWHTIKAKAKSPGRQGHDDAMGAPSENPTLKGVLPRDCLPSSTKSGWRPGGHHQQHRLQRFGGEIQTSSGASMNTSGHRQRGRQRRRRVLRNASCRCLCHAAITAVAGAGESGAFTSRQRGHLTNPLYRVTRIDSKIESHNYEPQELFISKGVS
jgi:hypothetical protein